MSAIPDHVRERLATLRVYQAGAAAATPAGKLSSNESPLGPAPAVRAAIAAAAGEVHRYPDARPLQEALATAEQVDPDQIVLTNGSDELCYLIAALYIREDSTVVLSDPCYQIEELVSRLHRGQPSFVSLRADGGHDLSALAAAAADASVVWLPTPHNPTGVAVDPDELDDFLDAVPDDCLVVLDEAYRDFVQGERRPRTLGLIERYPNLISQRTLSKAYALAGLRVGYGLANAGLIAAISQIKPPFNVNSLAIAAARAALDSGEWRERTVKLVVGERDLLQETLSGLGVNYFASQANFVTLQTEREAELMEALAAAGIAVRSGADLGLPGWVRISIGTPAVMAELRSVLEGVL